MNEKLLDFAAEGLVRNWERNCGKEACILSVLCIYSGRVLFPVSLSSLYISPSLFLCLSCYYNTIQTLSPFVYQQICLAFFLLTPCIFYSLSFILLFFGNHFFFPIICEIASSLFSFPHSARLPRFFALIPSLCVFLHSTLCSAAFASIAFQLWL